MAYLGGAVCGIFRDCLGLKLWTVWVEVVDYFVACIGAILCLVLGPLYGLFMDFYVSCFVGIS